MTVHPPAPKDASISLCQLLLFKFSINHITSASCVEERVRIVKNGCTLRPKSYPSSLRTNLRLAGPGIHGQSRIARSNTGSDTCVQYEALPVGCHTGTIVWTVLGHRLRRLCSVPEEIPYTSSFWASFKREPVCRIFSHIQRTHITVMRCCHSLSSLISRRQSQTHSQRRCILFCQCNEIF